MRGWGVGVCLALSLGCASGQIVFEFEPVQGNILTGDKVRLTKMTVDPRFYSRGCVALEVEGDEVRFAIQQDGTSDWVIGRAIPAMGREVALGLTAFAKAPIDLIQGLLGQTPSKPEPPSDVHGCGGLFTSR